MRKFYQSLYGEPWIWIRSLNINSIESWTDFCVAFLKYWGEKNYFDQYLIELNSFKRKEDEVVTTFNRRFHNFYCNISKDIQPSKTAAMLYYIKDQHPDLVFLSQRKEIPTTRPIIC
jgi:hypothetical protein